MRYTYKQLESDLQALNTKLERAGHEFRLIPGRRNNYTAVDLATPEQAARHCVQRTLIAGGTPRTCIDAAYVYVVNQIP